jgi:hypothetical protein
MTPLGVQEVDQSGREVRRSHGEGQCGEQASPTSAPTPTRGIRRGSGMNGRCASEQATQNTATSEAAYRPTHAPRGVDAG